LNQSVRGYLAGTGAVLLNGAVMAVLYYQPDPRTLAILAAAVVVATLPTVVADLGAAWVQLGPLRDYLAGRGPAAGAAQVLRRWPLLSALRVMGPHLLTITAFLLIDVQLAHRWTGEPIGLGQIAYFLPFFAVNALLHAVIEYLAGTRNVQELLTALREREGDRIASTATAGFRGKVLLVLAALGFLPALQVALMGYLRFYGYGVPASAQPTSDLLVVLWGLVSGLFFLYFGSQLLSRDVLKPLSELMDATSRLRQGDRSVRVDLAAWDEMGQLAEAMNQLASSLDLREREVQRAYRQTIAALSAAIEARDPYTKGHSERVAEYARRLAGELGWSEQQADEISLGGLLHDLGKIGVPENVLLKQGPLDAAERAEIERHPEIGYDIAKQSSALQPYLAAIRWHHERLDGSGYPDGLSGEQIPKAPLLLGVVDTWDALTSQRPYRPAMPASWTADLLAREASGGKLDGQMVAGLIELWKTGRLADLLQVEPPAQAASQPLYHTERSAAVTDAGARPGEADVEDAVEGAGGVVFSKSGEVLLIQDRSGRWTFPKGHIEAGESPEQAALREIQEETGVLPSGGEPLPETRYVNSHQISRRIHWFLMRGEGPVTPEQGGNVQEAAFFPVERAGQLVSFEGDRQLLAEALRQLAAQER
jgi:HD-GYP domain-containing protein (c-di-GMP phosphodiesterase class II)/8-oxo-dGTP pyrophosphatase MutT (NUDIX family)